MLHRWWQWDCLPPFKHYMNNPSPPFWCKTDLERNRKHYGMESYKRRII
jgi:hypothetical protein